MSGRSRRNRHGQARVKAQSNSEERKRPAILIYLRSIGGGLAIAGTSTIAIASSQYYWVGIGILCLGILTVAFDVLFEEWALKIRIGVFILCLLVAGWIAWKIVFLPAPLSVESTSLPGSYQVGSDVFGIKWEFGMSELRVSLSNSTSEDYDGLDFNIRPDVPTRLVSQVTHVPDVSLEINKQAGPISFTNMASGAYDKDGHMVQESPVDVYASGRGFRLRCPVLPAKTTIELIVALVNPRTRPRSNDDPAIINMIGGGPEQWAGPKQLATKLNVKGEYRVLYHPHYIDYTYTVAH